MELNLNNWLKNDDKNNKLRFSNNDNAMEFGVHTSHNSRQCIGKSLVEKELCAFFGNLLLKYKIIAPNNNPNDIMIEYAYRDLTNKVEPHVPVLIQKR